MKKNYIISPIYLLTLLNSVYSQQDMFAGYWINFENQKNCTASFVVNKQGVNGLLTSAQCCVNNNCLNGDAFDTAYENEDDGNVTKIGQVHDAQFGGASGLDYAFVSLDSVDWKPFLYTAGLTANDTINNGTITELYPVTADFTPTEPGLAVCAYGQGSGYLCGNLTELDLYIPVPNPWLGGRPTVLNVNKVDLGTEGMVSEEDLGGPVYVQSNNSNGTVTSQALGHIVATNNDDPNHKFLYYMPIDKILGAKNTELLTHTFKEKKVDDIETEYVEWDNNSIGINSIGINSIFYTDVYAGTKIGLWTPVEEGSRRCITGFAVKKKGYVYDSPGILTAGHCFFDSNNGEFKTGISVFVGDKDIGYSEMVGDKGGYDYAFIDTGYFSLVDPWPCIAVPRKRWYWWDTIDYLAVTSVVTPEIGTEACGFAEGIGLACGKIIDSDAGVLAKTPGIDGLKIRKGLYHIDIEKKSFEKESFGPGSSGAPIFVRTSDTTVQAVGIITSGIDDDKEKISVYVTPLSKIFSDSKLKLMTTKDCKSKSVQTRGQQEAKIEIPPKK